MKTRFAVPKRRSNPKRNKIELLAERAWLDRVDAEARRLGLTMSGYVRMVVTQRMDADEARREAEKGGRK